MPALDAEESDAGLVDVAVGRRGLTDAITVDRDTNINLVAFVAPGSRRDRRIYDADIKRAFELTRRYDLVIVAAMDRADPSLPFFAGLVDHIVLVAGADGFDQTRAEQFIARARPRCRQGPRRGADRLHDGMTPDMSRTAKPGFQSSAGLAAQPAVDLDTLVRSVLFLAAFLAAWISFHPFPDLSLPPQSVVEGGDPANQIGFSAMFLAFAAWTYWHEPRRLMLLVRPVLVATVAWCVLSVITSWEPALAARRLAFELIVISISAMILLLPKNLRHFSDLLAAAVLIVLAACYLGVFLLPQYAIHHATDFLEPEHAGELARRVSAQEQRRRRHGAVHFHRLLRGADAQFRARRRDRRAGGDFSRLHRNRRRRSAFCRSL